VSSSCSSSEYVNVSKTKYEFKSVFTACNIMFICFNFATLFIIVGVSSNYMYREDIKMSKHVRLSLVLNSIFTACIIVEHHYMAQEIFDVMVIIHLSVESRVW